MQFLSCGFLLPVIFLLVANCPFGDFYKRKRLDNDEKKQDDQILLGVPLLYEQRKFVAKEMGIDPRLIMGNMRDFTFRDSYPLQDEVESDPVSFFNGVALKRKKRGIIWNKIQRVKKGIQALQKSVVSVRNRITKLFKGSDQSTERPKYATTAGDGGPKWKGNSASSTGGGYGSTGSGSSGSTGGGWGQGGNNGGTGGGYSSNNNNNNNNQGGYGGSNQGGYGSSGGNNNNNNGWSRSASSSSSDRGDNYVATNDNSGRSAGANNVYSSEKNTNSNSGAVRGGTTGSSSSTTAKTSYTLSSSSPTPSWSIQPSTSTSTTSYTSSSSSPTSSWSMQPSTSTSSYTNSYKAGVTSSNSNSGGNGGGSKVSAVRSSRELEMIAQRFDSKFF